MTFNDETDIAFYDGNKEVKNSISCPSTGTQEDDSRKVEDGRKNITKTSNGGDGTMVRILVDVAKSGMYHNNWSGKEKSSMARKLSFSLSRLVSVLIQF